MKINKQVIQLFIIFSIFSTTVFASGEIHGMLKGGQDITIKPKNNYAFSITRAKGAASSRSSYNVKLTNDNSTIYEDKNIEDDIYLVFHDDILEGDRMHIMVNHGYFDYKLTPLLKLPKIVKNVLAPEVIKRAENFTKTKQTKTKQTKKKTLAKKKPIATTPISKSKPKTPLLIAPKKVESHIVNSADSPIEKSFFEKFTKIFKALVKSLAFNSNHAKTRVEVDKNSTLKNEKKPLSNKIEHTKKLTLAHFDDTLQGIGIEDKSRFSELKKGIDNTLSDGALKDSATLSKDTFTPVKRALNDNFDDSAILQSAAIASNEFTQAKTFQEVSKLPSQVEEKFSAKIPNAPKLSQERLSTKREVLPQFKSFQQAPVPAIETEISPESVPIFSKQSPLHKKAIVVESTELESPVNSYYQVPKTSGVSLNDRTEAYPDTGYKEPYKALEKQASVQEVKSSRQRVVEDTSLPRDVAVPSEGASDKLVITKIIDKNDPAIDPFAGRVLGRMDARVLGDGYNGAASSAKLGMRVTKNSRAVTAWVEVFKNGTKQRVKTFYTSKTRKTKKVKLPAGTYTVRATYRTRDTKQQKTIKNVHLKAGDNVNRSIAFHDGKVRVIARRGERPLYVKVIAYKSGSHQRVSYDFSSRTSGIAELSLSSGRYDIEVYDHKYSRIFDNIRIRAGKTNTINADF